ncbi:putative reverse transcriptase zinc-binding domain-containing protein [Helianthus annuus]|nr:putative reverse transcriptase zinc-binding domain-containing protein [Helianthus annuus]KAJ0895803.1 putative reverse transcriptase zinc-binding domain-containing protein [Helianthus annuus]
MEGSVCVSSNLLTRRFWLNGFGGSKWKIIVCGKGGGRFCHLTPPGVWNNIRKTEDKLFLNGKRIHSLVKGVVGNGNIRFWLDVWFGDSALLFKWPCLFALEKFKSCWVSDRLEVLGEELLFHFSWLRDPVSVSEIQELEEFVSSFGDVKLSAGRDRWVWSPEASGVFSTRSFKALAEEDRVEEVPFSVKGCGWVPAKCRIFMWRTALDRIPTRQALERRNIPVESSSCALCGEGVETEDHIFTACDVIMRVWNRFSGWINLLPIFAFSFSDVLNIHKGVSWNNKAKEIIDGLVIALCWAIWKARNEKIFANGRGNSVDIFGEVRSYGFFWLKNRSKYKDIVWREWCNYPLYML